MECLGHACLDWFGSISRRLLSERTELLTLRGDSIELLAHMRSRQFDKLRRGLHT